jgi:pimeloyl-ACP methyl ester carboxylesterase
VSGLVLVAPCGLWRDDLPLPDVFTIPVAEMPAMAWHDPASAPAKALSAMSPDPAEAVQRSVERMQSLAAATKFMWPIPEKGLQRRLHRVKAPVLIAWGDDDRLVPPAYAEEFRSRVAGSRVLTLAGAGHYGFVERLDEFVAAVRAFAG